MQTEQIQALINLTPMKMITENLKQVTEAIANSYEVGDTSQLPQLVATGKELLDAVDKLSR